jgi:hypothetical protein
MRLVSNGVVKRLYRQEFAARSLDDGASYQQLDLQAATPLLLVLATGMVLSLLLFAAELTVSRLSVLAAGTGSSSAAAPAVRKGSDRRALKRAKLRIPLQTEASQMNDIFPDAFIRKCISE